MDIENRRLVCSGKILQVVRNVLGRIRSARAFASCHIVNATQIVENHFGSHLPPFGVAGRLPVRIAPNPHTSLPRNACGSLKLR